MRGLIILIFLLFSGSIIAQNTVNQVDAQGRKQGLWTKKDTSGRLLYQATFKDDKPVGEMKRFHPNGKVKAEMNFESGTGISNAKLFDEQGNLIAQGKYDGQKKTGEWSYFLASRIVSTETYVNGLKEGLCKRFYTTGELFEESNWDKDKLNGIYRTYYQDGKIYLECNYTDGKRNGKFRTNFSNGNTELDASYTDEVKDSNWQYFDEGGKLLYTLKFDHGELLNPGVQDSIDRIKSDTYKTKEDRIPDPEKFMQNPEEYMNLMKNH